MKIFRLALAFNFFLGAVFLIAGQTSVYAQRKGFREERAEHFLIYYQPKVPRSKATNIKNLAEKYYRVITQEFHLIRDKLWVWEDRAQIFIASDRENYAKHFNCYSWSDACVDYRNKIIYTYLGQQRFSGILSHELTHIIFREYAGKSTFPLWLDEGVATYMEDKYGGGHYSKYLRIVKKKLRNDEHIPLMQLVSMSPQSLNGKSQEYINLFYAESFSLVSFIIAKYGRHNFSMFLSYLRKGFTIKKALAKVYFDFRTFEDLERHWRRYYL